MKNSPLDERVIEAKNNSKAMDVLIDEYKPFIASQLSKARFNFFARDKDELMTVGMMAFYEAINSYDLSKGSFLSFSKLVIKSRVIDDFRKKENQFDFDEFDVDSPQIAKIALDRHNELNQRHERVQAIRLFNEELKQWDLSLSAIAKASPRSKALKTLYQSMSRFLVESEGRLEEIKQSKRIPIKLLEEEFGVNRKKIERGRSYICACLLLLNESYISINDYIK